MERQVKIGFVSIEDPTDKKASSGTTYKINQALLNLGYEVIWIPVKKTFIYKFIHKLLRAVGLLFNRNCNFARTTFGAKLIYKSIRLTDMNKCDLLFYPFSASALYGTNTIYIKLSYLWRTW